MTLKEKIIFLEEKLNAVRRAEKEATKAFRSLGYIENQYNEPQFMKHINNLRLKLVDEILTD